MLRRFYIRCGGLCIAGEVDETSPGFYGDRNPHENEEREYELKVVYFDDADAETTTETKDENPVYQCIWNHAVHQLNERYEEIVR